MRLSGGTRRLVLRLILGLLPPLSAWGAIPPHPKTETALKDLGFRADEGGNLIRIELPASMILRQDLESAGFPPLPARNSPKR